MKCSGNTVAEFLSPDECTQIRVLQSKILKAAYIHEVESYKEQIRNIIHSAKQTANIILSGHKPERQREWAAAKIS